MALTANQQAMHDQINATLNAALDTKAKSDRLVVMANGFHAPQAAADAQALSDSLIPHIQALQAEIAIYNDVGAEG